MTRPSLFVPIVAALLARGASPQPIVLNTRLTDTVDLDALAPTWSAGNWGYRTATNRYLLQTLGSGGLAVIDTTDNSNAFVTGTVTGISVKEVKVYSHYAYATTDSGPTRVIDLANPSSPVLVNSITEGAHTLQVDIANGRLYLNRASQSQLRILNVAANQVTPPLLVAYSTPIHDSAPEGNTVYVWGASGGICTILGVGALPTVTTLGSFNVNGGYLHSGDLYVRPNGQKILLTCNETAGGHLKIWDVTNPAAVSFLTEWSTGNASLSIHNVYVRGAYAYVAYYAEGLRILDLTNPLLPQQVGIHDPNPTNILSPSFGIYTDAWDPYPYHDAIYVDTMFTTLAGAGYPQGSYLVDFFPAFGTGCPGTGGLVPTAWWSYGPPSPGNADFALRLRDAKPLAPALLLVGFSNSAWGPFSLPLNLASLGAAGCTLYASAEFIFPAATNASGRASIALPVPAAISPGLLWCQWAVFDPGAPNAADLAFSAGGKLVIE